MTTFKTTLNSSAAFIRPTALERSMGRLMRSPEGHGDSGAGGGEASGDDSSADAAAGTAADTGAAADAGTDAGASDGTALGSGGDGEAGEGDTAADGDAAADEGGGGDDNGKGEVPETYELTAPEGLTLDPAAVELATPVFKELGLTNEQANKLMPVASQFAQGLVDKHNAAILSQVAADRKAWLDTAKADPEIGGNQWKDTIAIGAKALDQLGLVKGSPFRVLLDESGLGNHPEMIRAFRKVGEAIGEDSSFARAGETKVTRDKAEVLYPDDKPKGA